MDCGDPPRMPVGPGRSSSSHVGAEGWLLLAPDSHDPLSVTPFQNKYFHRNRPICYPSGSFLKSLRKIVKRSHLIWFYSAACFWDNRGHLFFLPSTLGNPCLNKNKKPSHKVSPGWTGERLPQLGRPEEEEEQREAGRRGGCGRRGGWGSARAGCRPRPGLL